MKKKKEIIYVTGTRAEYGIMRSLLADMVNSGFFNVSILATGMHLSKKFGHTIDEIKKDGFKIVGVVDMKVENNMDAGMAKSLGLGVIGFAEKLAKLKPDLVLLAGDRGETLAAAISASHLNIPIAHISGGDFTTGATIDERMRHAITHFADIHFPESRKSAKRIIAMTGSDKNIFLAGNPGLDNCYIPSEKRRAYISRVYKLDLKKPFLLVIQHPITRQPQESKRQMEETMSALKELKIQTIIVYPCSDAGNKGIIEVINKNKNLEFIRVLKNIKRDDFMDLMALAGAIVGNSSSALTEALSFRLPAVNIGKRQEGREAGNNIINANHDKIEIIKAIKKALSPKFKKRITKKNPYAFEDSKEKIIEILRRYESADI